MWQEKHRVGGPSRQIDSFADTEIDILIEDEDYFVFIKAKVVAPGRTARFGTWKRQGASLVAVADPELHEALRQIGILYAVREPPRGGAPPLGFGSGETFLGPQVLLAVELDRLLDGDEVDLAPDQGLHDLDHLREAATEPRQLADQQTVAGLQRPQHFVDAIALLDCDAARLPVPRPAERYAVLGVRFRRHRKPRRVTPGKPGAMKAAAALAFLERRKTGGANRRHAILRTHVRLRHRVGPSARNRLEPVQRRRPLPPRAGRAAARRGRFGEARRRYAPARKRMPGPARRASADPADRMQTAGIRRLRWSAVKADPLAEPGRRPGGGGCSQETDKPASRAPAGGRRTGNPDGLTPCPCRCHPVLPGAVATMTESGSENGEPLIDARTDKWFDRIYNEEDFARNLAIGAGAGAGLYLAWDHWTAPFFAAAMAFSIVKLLVGPWKESRERKRMKRHLKELFDNLGHEERGVVESFAVHGGSVMTWGECDHYKRVSRAGIESLINRGLIQMSMTADGMTETFVLDAQLFDYAREDVINHLFDA